MSPFTKYSSRIANTCNSGCRDGFRLGVKGFRCIPLSRCRMHNSLAYICNTTDVPFHMSQASCVGGNQEDESCSQWPSSSQDAVSHWVSQACKTLNMCMPCQTALTAQVHKALPEKVLVLMLYGGIPCYLCCKLWHKVKQHSTAQHSTAQHSIAQHSIYESTVRHSMAEESTVQHTFKSTARHSTALIVLHSTAQHSTAQRSTAQYSKQQQKPHHVLVDLNLLGCRVWDLVYSLCKQADESSATAIEDSRLACRL